ncbi:MAG: metallopeptidase [Phycisphaerae bacterium]|jgi:hypothetical protein|nr:metallopeptidase [Phycisphaerae bacterium]
MKRGNVLGIIVGCCLCVVFAVAANAAAPAREAVEVVNFVSGETVRFPVVLIYGRLADAELGAVSVSRGPSKWTGLAKDGRFKVLVELAPGANRLVISAGRTKARLLLNYKPQTNPHVVRVFYFVDKSGDTRFQTPLENDPQNWRGKLDTAMKLMQTFTAQRLGDLGLGRKTFNLELDDKGRVKVHVLKGRHDASYYQKLTGGQLYSQAAAEIRKQSPKHRTKNLVIPAFTRFDPKTSKVGAHTALGGGHLALFGGGDLFSWPDSIPQAQTAFMNATRVDPKEIFSDSIGRHTFWANASTTMGAALHEIGHTFGLPHSRDSQDIMTRGHDRLNRFFTLREPPHARRKNAIDFKDNEIAYWAPVSAGALAFNRFFALDDRTWKSEGKVITTLDSDAGRIIFKSQYGVRYVGVWRIVRGGQIQSLIPAFISKKGVLPTDVTIDLAGLKKQLGDMKYKFRVIDNEGLGSTILLSSLLSKAADNPAGKTGK